MYGNRGCLVDSSGRIVRPFKEIRWIICVLSFKGRRHPMMAPGRYTGLFFLDEATALAAGHRPCAECQRDRFNLFREHWANANSVHVGAARLLAPVMDTVLHSERISIKLDADSIDQLPNGTFVTYDQRDAYLVVNGDLLRWTPGGYERLKRTTTDSRATLLTPPSVVRALRAGYPAEIHASSKVCR